MTTKRNPKIEQYRNLGFFFENYVLSNQLPRTTKLRKSFGINKVIETL